MKRSLAVLTLAAVPALGYAQANSQSSQPAAPEAGQRCELSSGAKMIAGISASAADQRRSDHSGPKMDFFTSGPVVTSHGINIPFGIFKGSVVNESGDWTLILTQLAGDGITPPKSSSPLVFQIPLSVSKSASFLDHPAISFEPVGKTCTVRLEWQGNRALIAFAATLDNLSSK